MLLLNVYVEGAKESSAEGVRRVAAQISARYGLSATDLEKRLTAGRFRVKANVDEETANAFAADLESLGARCTIVAAGVNPASRASQLPPRGAGASHTLTGLPPLGDAELASDEPAPRAVPPPPAVLARPGAMPQVNASSPPPLPLGLTSRTMTLPMGSLPIRPAATSSSPMQLPEATPAPSAHASAPGLASVLADATFTTGQAALDTGTFSLTSLDEHDEPAPPPPPVAQGRPGPALPGLPPSVAPALQWTPQAAPPGSPDATGRLAPEAPTRAPLQGLPIERFGPPVEDHVLTLEAPRLVRNQLLAPESSPMMAPAIAAPYTPAASGVAMPQRRARARIVFTVGIFLSLALGFAPAHLMAASRERAAFEKIDNRVRAAQSGITSQEEWKALDDIRTARMRDKRGARQEIALLAILMWLGASACLSAGWVRWAIPRLAPDK